MFPLEFQNMSKAFFQTCGVLENVFWGLLGACRGQAGLGEGYLQLPEQEHRFSDVFDISFTTVLLQFQGILIYLWVAWD